MAVVVVDFVVVSFFRQKISEWNLSHDLMGGGATTNAWIMPFREPTGSRKFEKGSRNLGGTKKSPREGSRNLENFAKKCFFLENIFSD